MSKDLFSNQPATKRSSLGGTIAVSISGIALFFSGQFFGALTGIVALSLFGLSQDEITNRIEESISVQLFFSLLVSMATIWLLWFVAKWVYGRKQIFRGLLLDKLPNKHQVLEIFLTYSIYFVSLVAVVSLTSVFTNVNIDQAQELGVATVDDNQGKLAIFVMLVIIPPIIEELLFRGYLFNALRKFANKYLSVITTSILFGLAHLEFSNLNWIAAIDTTLFSVFLIYISQKHQSLYSAMLLHSIKNSIAFYVLFVHV